jgi:hypothetical protein
MLGERASPALHFGLCASLLCHQGQAAIIELTRALRDKTGNLPPMPGDRSCGCAGLGVSLDSRIKESLAKNEKAPGSA